MPDLVSVFVPVRLFVVGGVVVVLGLALVLVLTLASVAVQCSYSCCFCSSSCN